MLRKSYQVWAPKAQGSDQKGPLAVASDGVNWDVPNQSFEVRFPGNPRIYTWRLGRTVTETGAHKFGSSQDDDKASKPIATLTYDILLLIDLPNGSNNCAYLRLQERASSRRKTSSRRQSTWALTSCTNAIASWYNASPARQATLLHLRLPVCRRSRTIEDAKSLRGLYDTYAKSGFVDWTRMPR